MKKPGQVLGRRRALCQGEKLHGRTEEWGDDRIPDEKTTERPQFSQRKRGGEERDVNRPRKMGHRDEHQGAQLRRVLDGGGSGYHRLLLVGLRKSRRANYDGDV